MCVCLFDIACRYMKILKQILNIDYFHDISLQERGRSYDKKSMTCT